MSNPKLYKTSKDFQDYPDGATLPIEEPPCRWCENWKPHIKRENDYDAGVVFCYQPDDNDSMCEDFSCFREKPAFTLSKDAGTVTLGDELMAKYYKEERLFVDDQMKRAFDDAGYVPGSELAIRFERFVRDGLRQRFIDSAEAIAKESFAER